MHDVESGSYTVQFDAAGRFKYRCRTHEASGMFGIVQVVDPNAPPPPPVAGGTTMSRWTTARVTDMFKMFDG